MADQLIIVTAIAPKDHPGIIAALTRAVLEHGGNLDDATMTRLHGAFATMIAARIAPEKLPQLHATLDSIAARHELHIALQNLGERIPVVDHKIDGPDHIITVYGADHPGIVHHVASCLEEFDANITDLETRLTGESGRPIYVMMLETSGGDWDNIPHALSRLGEKLSVDISFSVLDEETL